MRMLISIGRVLKPWGVRGEVKVETLTDFPERFKDLRRIYLESPSGKKISAEISAARYVDGAPFLLIAGYDTPEKSRTLNGWYIRIPQEEAVPLPEGSYYWFELIGMEVVSEGGEKLGTITDILQTGSNDVYVIKRGRKEIYIPATREVVRQVDKASNRMVIHLMDGLME